MSRQRHQLAFLNFLLSINIYFFPQSSSKKGGKVKTAYKCDHVNVGCDVNYDINGTAIHGAAVVGYEGWLAGYQMTFEAGRNKVTQSNFAVGYKTDEFQLHTNV